MRFNRGLCSEIRHSSYDNVGGTASGAPGDVAAVPTPSLATSGNLAGSVLSTSIDSGSVVSAKPLFVGFEPKPRPPSRFPVDCRRDRVAFVAKRSDSSSTSANDTTSTSLFFSGESSQTSADSNASNTSAGNSVIFQQSSAGDNRPALLLEELRCRLAHPNLVNQQQSTLLSTRKQHSEEVSPTGVERRFHANNKGILSDYVTFPYAQQLSFQSPTPQHHIIPPQMISRPLPTLKSPTTVKRPLESLSSGTSSTTSLLSSSPSTMTSFSSMLTSLVPPGTVSQSGTVTTINNDQIKRCSKDFRDKLPYYARKNGKNLRTRLAKIDKEKRQKMMVKNKSKSNPQRFTIFGGECFILALLFIIIAAFLAAAILLVTWNARRNGGILNGLRLSEKKWRNFASNGDDGRKSGDNVPKIREEKREPSAEVPPTNGRSKALRTSGETPYSRPVAENATEHVERGRALMEHFSAQRIMQNLRSVASDMHVAGTEEQLELMDRLQRKYRSYGYDVEAFDYDVLLNYPDYARPNEIHRYSDVLDEWMPISDGLAERLDPEDPDDGDTVMEEKPSANERQLVWWNAYSKNGSAEGEVVYVNYGTLDDYRALEKLNVSLRGKIALIRYGAVFRGDKALMAEQRGAVAVILYSDPYDFASDASNNTFPDGIWLPGSGAQRGTLLRTVGDPQTPFLPSRPYVHRSATEESLRSAGVLPNVPITSIGYRDALHLFRHLDGAEVPWSSWRGALRVKYRITGRTRFRLDVRSVTRQRRIRNFVARMYGAESPDEWILLGNHADAWVKGAIDPGTGTATMLEMAHALAAYSAESEWRPRRTICFCQWDAEEFGLIGSTEWVEENLRLLEDRAVVYLNVDHINGNTTLDVKAVPMLYRAIVDAASRVKHPMSDRQPPHFADNGNRPDASASSTASGTPWFNTLLDAWSFYSPKGPLPGDRSVPGVQPPSSLGSDYQRFIGFVGVPVADLRLQNAPIYSYMLYHTMYETPWAVENLVDPNAAGQVAVGRMWLELARNLADSLLIPFNVEDYGTMLSELFLKMDVHLLHLRMDIALGEPFYRDRIDQLQRAIYDFQKRSVRLQHLIQAVNSGQRVISLRQASMINARLRAVERCFIVDVPSAARPLQRHALFTAPEQELFGGNALALVLDPAMRWWTRHNDAERPEPTPDVSGGDAADYLAEVRLGLSYLQYAVESATAALRTDGFD